MVTSRYKRVVATVHCVVFCVAIIVPPVFNDVNLHDPRAIGRVEYLCGHNIQRCCAGRPASPGCVKFCQLNQPKLFTVLFIRGRQNLLFVIYS